ARFAIPSFFNIRYILPPSDAVCIRRSSNSTNQRSDSKKTSLFFHWLSLNRAIPYSRTVGYVSFCFLYIPENFLWNFCFSLLNDSEIQYIWKYLILQAV